MRKQTVSNICKRLLILVVLLLIVTSSLNFNMIAHAASKKAVDYVRERVASTSDPASFLLSEIKERSERITVQVATYSYYLCTFKWSDMVKKVGESNETLANCQMKALQAAFAALSSFYYDSLDLSLEDENFENVLEDTDTLLEYWGDTSETLSTLRKMLLERIENEKIESLTDDSDAGGIALALASIALQTGIDAKHYTKWRKDQRQLYNVSISLLVQYEVLLQQVLNTCSQDPVIAGYCRNMINEVSQVLQSSNLTDKVDEFDGTGFVLQSLANNAASGALDFVVAWAAKALFSTSGATLTLFGSGVGLLTDFVLGISDTATAGEDIDQLYTYIENVAEFYKHLKKDDDEIGQRFIEFYLLYLKIEGLGLTANINKGQNNDSIDPIISAYEEYAEMLISYTDGSYIVENSEKGLYNENNDDETTGQGDTEENGSLWDDYQDLTGYTELSTWLGKDLHEITSNYTDSEWEFFDNGAESYNGISLISKDATYISRIHIAHTTSCSIEGTFCSMDYSMAIKTLNARGWESISDDDNSGITVLQDDRQRTITINYFNGWVDEIDLEESALEVNSVSDYDNYEGLTELSQCLGNDFNEIGTYLNLTLMDIDEGEYNYIYSNDCIELGSYDCQSIDSISLYDGDLYSLFDIHIFSSRYDALVFLPQHGYNLTEVYEGFDIFLNQVNESAIFITYSDDSNQSISSIEYLRVY